MSFMLNINFFKSTIFFMFLVFFDFMFILFIHEITMFIRESLNFSLSEFESYSFDKIFWINLLLIFIFMYEKLYFQRFDFWKELQKILFSLFYGFIIVLTILSLTKMIEEYSRSYILIFFSLLAITFPIYKKVTKDLLFKLSFFKMDILVITDNKKSEKLRNWYSDGNYYGFEVKKIIDVNRRELNNQLEDIEKLIKKENYYACVLSVSSLGNKKLFYMIDHIQHHISKVIVIPKEFKVPLFNAEIFNSLDRKEMALFIRNNLLNRFDRFIKSLFDYVVSFILILATFPFLFILWLVVAISSGGSPLFKHRRIGQDGRSFNVYKFRTMKKNADLILKELLENDPKSREEWEKEFKLKNDPRITPIGKFLRKTSLDELPQIINVLQGKMSLVGPRPIVKDEIIKYGDYFDYFSAVKPGITGLWQVSGRNDISYNDRVQLDVWYTRNWSIGLDIIILIKTVSVVILKKGSY